MTTTTASFTPNPLQNPLHYNGSTHFPSYNGYPLQIEKTLGHGSFGMLFFLKYNKTIDRHLIHLQEMFCLYVTLKRTRCTLLRESTNVKTKKTI